MPFTHDVVQDLGKFMTPYLIEWWRKERAEYTSYYKQVAELRGQIRRIDKQFRPQKVKIDAHAASTKTLIRHRERVHEEVKYLEHHLFILKRHLCHFDSIIDAAIQPYARQSCLELTTALHTKLPRELRDMIYGHLLESSIVDFVTHYVTHEVSNLHEPGGRELPFFFTSNFTCPFTISEMMHLIARIYLAGSTRLSKQLVGAAEGLNFPSSEFISALSMDLSPSDNI